MFLESITNREVGEGGRKIVNWLVEYTIFLKFEKKKMWWQVVNRLIKTFSK